LAISGLALAIPCAAHADVLEIHAGQSAWVAGGPDALAGASVLAGKIADQPVAAAEALAPASSHPLALTEVAGEAGPAAWRARVAELAAKYDISPSLLEAVVWQESRWNPAAVSPVGARGLAQLMPGTAQQMGVNPNDPRANLEGGARYLRMQLDAFGGDVEKALAAYNAGPGRVKSAGGIPAIRETQEYVASIMSRLSQPVRR
jgi:soluble lytic murein transglycosylase-like protein